MEPGHAQSLQLMVSVIRELLTEASYFENIKLNNKCIQVSGNNWSSVNL